MSSEKGKKRSISFAVDQKENGLRVSGLQGKAFLW